MLLGFLRRTHSAKQPIQSGELDTSKVSEDSAYQKRGASEDASREAGKSSEDHLAELHLGCAAAAAPVGELPQPVPEERGLQASDFRRKADARPSHDSAMVHTSSSASMSMSTSSVPGGRRSSSTFERKPAYPAGRHSSIDAGRHSSSGAFGASTCSSSVPTGRGSTESTHSEQTSGRSSFAMEQEPSGGHGGGSVDSAMRPSLESFGFGGATASTRTQSAPTPMSSEELQALCAQMRVPPAMHARFLRLAVLHPSLPVPMQALCHLWRLSHLADAEATAAMFQERSIMRVACLADGSAWALVQPDQFARLQACCPLASEVHAELLERYSAGAASLANVPDDGYFLQAVGHHCMGANQAALLEGLLSQPEWLHNKLRAYGVASLVSDFRRYLSAPGHNPDVKLLLEAFQMALAAWGLRPEAAMLRAQMVSRLISASGSAFLTAWLAQQRAAAAAAVALPAVSELKQQHLWGGKRPPLVQCLVAATASLTQAGGLHRMLLRGHASPLTSMLLSPSGIDLVTGDEAGDLRVWDLELGDCTSVLAGHSGAINALSIASAGNVLVSAASDGTCRVWDLQQGGACRCVLVGHTGSVKAVAVEPKGRFCITAGADGSARVWSLATAACALILQDSEDDGHPAALHAVSLTRDGRTAVTASADFRARCYDLTSGECTATMEGHSGWVTDVKITPTGRFAVTASHDHTARVWNVADGTCKVVLEGHTGRLNQVALSDDGAFAVTASDDGTARVWRIPRGDCIHVLSGHGGFVTSVTIAADGRKAITTSGDLLGIVWDLQTGTALERLQGHSATVTAAVMTRKSRFAATASADHSARVWNLLADSEKLIPPHAGKVTSLQLSPDGCRLASIADDAAKLWAVDGGDDGAQGDCLATLEGHATSLRYGRFLADGQRLLTASGDRQVNIWDTADSDAAPACSLQAVAGSRVRSIAASADGATAVVVLFDSSVAVWDLRRGECTRVLQKRGQWHMPQVHSGGVNAGYLSPDARHVLTASKDHTARWWDVEQGTSIKLAGHEDSVTAAAITSCGRRAITISDDGTGRCWDLTTGSCRAVLRLGAAPAAVRVSADDTLCVIPMGATAAAYDFGTARLLSRFTGHTSDITDAAISADSMSVLTVGADATLRLWSADTGQMRAFFVADTGLSCCTISKADSRTVLVAGADNGCVHFLPL